MSTEERQIAELTTQVKELTEAVSNVAYGLAKITERCFCGHRLDLHAENVGACSVLSCDFKCQFFIPVFLAQARILHNVFMQIYQIREVFQGAAPPAGGGKIVSPFH